MRRYADTFFRHRIIAVIPILVLPLAGLVLALQATPTMSAKANMFVDSVTLKQISYVDPYVTPAQNMQSYLNQLLMSQSFDLGAGRRSPLYWQMIAALPNPSERVVADFGKNVGISALGPNLLVISYSDPNGQMGVQLVQGILDQAAHEITLISQQQATKDALTYQRQLNHALARFNASAQALSSYLSDHKIPSAEIALRQLSDPKLAALYQAVQNAQTDVTSVQQQLSNTRTQQIARTTFRIIDRPSATIVTVSRKKQLANLLLPLVVGLLLAGAFVVLRTALDRSVRFIEEVPDLLGLPVLAVVPYSPALASVRRASRSSADAMHRFPLQQRDGSGIERVV